MRLEVNGRPVDVETDPHRTLLEVLREELELTGTKYGCGEGACGACSVLIDGKRTFSCSTRVGDAAGKSIVTIEGLTQGDVLHPAQQAFLECEAFQCGYCTPGMIIAAAALVDRKPDPSDEEIREWMNGHICRCCGYTRIAAAVKRCAELAAK